MKKLNHADTCRPCQGRFANTDSRLLAYLAKVIIGERLTAKERRDIAAYRRELLDRRYQRFLRQQWFKSRGFLGDWITR